LFAYDFRTGVNSQSYSDVVFKVQNKPIYAHKCVVFARCPALKKLQTDSQQKEIVIEGTEYYVFIAFMRYLYTDHLKAVPHHVPKLGVLAERYCLPRLGALCKRFLLFNDAPLTSGDLAEIPAERIYTVPDSTFSQDMDAAVNVEDCSDIYFQLTDGKIRANKMVLTSRSDYFRTIFKGGFKETAEDMIEVLEIDKDTLLLLLRFIYTNQVNLKSDDVVNVLMAAGRFLLDDLKQVIEKQLEEDLDVENAVDFLGVAEALNAPKLRRACITVLAERYKETETALKKADHIPTNTLRHIEFLHRKRLVTM